MTPAEQDLSLRGTGSQGEVSGGLVLKASGRNIDNGDSCSTPLCNVLNVRTLPIKSDLYSVSVNRNEDGCSTAVLQLLTPVLPIKRALTRGK
jgi:hypothetical protein